MPSVAVGKLVRRGRPRGKPSAVRSVRLPQETWKRLEAEARSAKTTVNALIAKRVG
jgi:predicted DNA-binding ribbon-helix-helix protein